MKMTFTQELKRAAFGVLLCLFLVFPIVSIHGQAQPEVAPPAKSDTYAVASDGKKYRVQHREVARTNFQIAGVNLASDEEVLLQASNQFGKNSTVSGGDAATSNKEICYRSDTENDSTYLVFGRGEVDSSFILASNGSAGEGSHICKRSGKITKNIATESGLRLGLTQKQVVAILGLATRYSQNSQKRNDTLIYSLESKKKTDSQKLARWWQRETKKNPAASQPEFLENYTFYELEVHIAVQFESDSLTRLTVSWSAQY